MDFGVKRKKEDGSKDVAMSSSDNKNQPKYPSFRIEPSSPAYKELAKMKVGTKLTLTAKFVVASAGTREDVDGGNDNYGNFVELELHSCTKPSNSSENPYNGQG